MKPIGSSPQRGFTLIEALIALLIVAFGLLTLVGINLKLSSSEDVARQRAEATRLAQEKIEAFRSYTQLTSSSTTLAWSDLASGSDTISSSAGYSTNTQFNRRWTLLGAATDPMRTMQVTVGWTDRAGNASSVAFATVISKTDPTDSGSLGVPLPANTTLKRPKSRNLNIPVPATDLGNGQSVVQLLSNFAVIFSNDSGYVVKTCTKSVTTASDLSSGCTDANAYIVAGYISLDTTSTFPGGLIVDTGLFTGTTGVQCAQPSAAVDQVTGGTISGYDYYLCVVSVANAGNAWAGKMRLGGLGLSAGSNYLVCRFQYPASAGGTANDRNVQPYANVVGSLDNQNYVITTKSSCPTVSSLPTTLHQTCTTSNTSRLTDCPLT
jgi:type IV pilus modification protein PilV